jgi:hypothetical protein
LRVSDGLSSSVVPNYSYNASNEYDNDDSLEELDQSGGLLARYLRPVTTGSKVSQTEAVPGDTPPVKLRSTGIQVNYFEKGKVVLHWNTKRKKIEEFQTGD